MLQRNAKETLSYNFLAQCRSLAIETFCIVLETPPCFQILENKVHSIDLGKRGVLISSLDRSWKTSVWHVWGLLFYGGLVFEMALSWESLSMKALMCVRLSFCVQLGYVHCKGLR